MTHVATLIGHNALHAARRVQAMFPRAGSPVSLGPDAADVPFTAKESFDQRAIATALRAEIGEACDIVVQPLAHRRKKLFLADMDSTMIGQECIDELADYVGLKDHIAAITERAMRGEIAFEPALRERVALLKGLSSSVIDNVLKTRVTVMPGARVLIATMRANGAYTAMVSGGFTLFTDHIARLIGFDESRANRLVIKNGRLAGTVAEPIFGRDAKRAALIDLRTKLGLLKEDTLATGDGANDMDMIAEAGLGIAYRAKPKVAAAAPACIEHADLTALLYVQGYRREEFVEA
ncbi:MAG: phosphoserine phosphatase SerB [Acidobacteriota bacterium]|jgi:phosphoserine phosphatase